MGKKLMDVLLGRKHLYTSKFKALLNLAVSRLAILKNQRRARCSIARSDLIQLLHLGHHDRALLRVEQVIKEQNMSDVLLMIEGYCHLLVERINLIEQERVCPEELKEAVSSLIYAATRCGEFPELQEMRAIFTSRFGKEFAASAIELRNNCRVNPKMIQKLSTRQPTLENRMKVLKEIASENNIVLQNEEASSGDTEEKLETEQKQNQPTSTVVSGGYKHWDDLADDIDTIEGLSGSMKSTRKYKDVADAAEAAFKSAAYAAAAARAAVELSRSESRDPDDHNNRGPNERKIIDKNDSMNSKIQTGEGINLRRADDENERGGEALSRTHGLGFDTKPIFLANEGMDSGKFYTVQDEDLSEKGSGIFSRSKMKFPLRSQAELKPELGPGNPKARSTEGSRIQSADRFNAENRPISVRTRRAQGR